MRNGLLRVQCYLTAEAYQKFSAEFEKFNRNREEKNKLKLSESGFCQLKLTDIAPRLRGAPKNNKNAVGRKSDSAVLGSQNTFPKEVAEMKYLLENIDHTKDNFDSPSPFQDLAEYSPPTIFSVDKNSLVKDKLKDENIGELKDENSFGKTSVDSTAFEGEKFLEGRLEETVNFSEICGRLMNKNSCSEMNDTVADEKLMSEDNIDYLLANFNDIIQPNDEHSSQAKTIVKEEVFWKESRSENENENEKQKPKEDSPSLVKKESPEQLSLFSNL